LKTEYTMPFNLQPTLEGKLLSLRPLQPEDFQELYAVASDPLIWEQHPNSDRHELEVFKEFFKGAVDSGGALVAIDAKDGRITGSSRFYEYREQESEVEIGFTFLARSHWGGAYNGEMKQLMLRHAFEFVENVIFVIGLENFRSRRAVEKIGAIYVGTQVVRGYERVVYRITKNAK
jgi:RimJ/RimL family protein N-acetyltransferase